MPTRRPDTLERRGGEHPFAVAQDALVELIDASVRAQRIESMHAAMRVDVTVLTVGYALRAEAAFVAPSLSPERRREMAQRAVTAELATALRVPERTMERMIDEACTLSRELPSTLLALRSGEITMQHARVVIDATLNLVDDPALRARLDERLAEAATTTTAAGLRRRARALREELLAESITERHRAALALRRIEVEPVADGMAWLHALLPATDALLIADRLDRIAKAAADDHRVDEANVGAVGISALRADAARDLLLYGALPAGSEFADAASAVRPTVHVTVPVLSLMDTSDAPAVLDGYGPIDAESARRLAASAPSFMRLLTHPVDGTVLDVDRTSYRPPADLKRWLQVRDGTCRFPGCARRASRCDVDHTTEWADEGRTSHDNLAHLCPLHHHLKHESSWTVRHRAGAVLEWTSPAGRVHVTRPSVEALATASPPGRAHATQRSVEPLTRASPPGPHDRPTPRSRAEVLPTAPPF